MAIGKRARWTFGLCVAMALIAFSAMIGLLDFNDADRAEVSGSAGTSERDTGSSPRDPAAELSALPPETPEAEVAAISATASAQAADGAQSGWSVVDPNAIAPERLPPFQETYTDARLVSLTGNPGNWGPGSRVVFDIPHTGERLEAVIERVEPGLAGSISYIGRVDRDDALHRVVVTVGVRNAFAFIDSDSGSYEMVGNREFGWLMSTVGMEMHVDYSKPDYYIPDNNEQIDP